MQTRAPLITAAAVVALLGISRSKVYELARGGRLPAYRIDDAVRFGPEDVEASAYRPAPWATLM
jgi:excisionase family DNA binding protein